MEILAIDVLVRMSCMGSYPKAPPNHLVHFAQTCSVQDVIHMSLLLECGHGSHD